MDEKFVTIHIEAALCGWEWYLENREGESPAIAALNKYRDEMGTVELRHLFIGYSTRIDMAYKIAVEAGYDDTYDWHFVPNFLELAINANDTDNCSLRSEWEQVAKSMGDYEWPNEIRPS